MESIVLVQCFNYIAKAKPMQLWFLLCCCDVVIYD